MRILISPMTTFPPGAVPEIRLGDLDLVDQVVVGPVEIGPEVGVRVADQEAVVIAPSADPAGIAQTGAPDIDWLVFELPIDNKARFSQKIGPFPLRITTPKPGPF